MRHLVALSLITTLAVAGCWKKDDAQEASSMPPAQNAPVVQQAAPQAQVQIQAQQQAAAPVPVNAGQPIRPETIIVTQKFTCKNQTAFTARFMHNPSQVEITFTGRMPVVLPKEYTASGFSYKTAQYKLVGQGNQAQWTMTGKNPVDRVVTK